MLIAQALPGSRHAGGLASGHAPTGECDEGALLTAVAAGDVAALDELYRRYRPVAFAAALGLLRDPSAAEDAVHDAFLRIWRAAASFHPERGALRSWLLTIVRNAAIDTIRARHLAQRPETANALGDLHAAGEEDVAALVTATAEAARLRAALTTLPPAQRDAVELAFFAGLTHGEIARRTGLPLGTVKGRVRLGLRRLRHDLGDLAPSAC
jgi:RNA polymerase sigma-70 factor (ECF subfamily)